MKVYFKFLIPLIFLVILLAFLVNLIFSCNHDTTYLDIARPATCSEAGQVDIICVTCNKTVGSKHLNPVEHVVSNYSLLKAPSVNKNGLEAGICSICDSVTQREVICPHIENVVSIVKEPTCSEFGLETTVCSYCDTLISERSLYMLECSYGDWIYSEYATPFKSGQRHKECMICKNIKTETYAWSMPGKNCIYIPGTGINNCITPGEFTQEDVNRYDIVYTESSHYLYDASSCDNPFVLGHNTGSLKDLHKTELGQYIYLSVDGKIETYKVVVSEFANASYWEIIGCSTGTSIWENYGCKTLHMYTCHGGSNGRWIVLATLVTDKI